MNFSKLMHKTKFSGIVLFAIIIISVNFQLKQLSANFLPLTISFCSSIPISSLVVLLQDMVESCTNSNFVLCELVISRVCLYRYYILCTMMD